MGCIHLKRGLRLGRQLYIVFLVVYKIHFAANPRIISAVEVNRRENLMDSWLIYSTRGIIACGMDKFVFSIEQFTVSCVCLSFLARRASLMTLSSQFFPSKHFLHLKINPHITWIAPALQVTMCRRFSFLVFPSGSNLISSNPTFNRRSF